MTSEFAVIEQDWMLGNIGGLQARSHLAGVERIAVVIRIPGDNHCRGIGHALLHIVVWRVPGESGKVIGIVDSAELIFPNVRVIEMVVAQHVQDGDHADHCPEKIRPLRHCRSDQQARV